MNTVIAYCAFSLTSRLSSFQAVARSCLTLCDPMDCSTPGFPVHHKLPEFGQTHIHRVSDVIQPSQTLSSPSAPFNLSQNQDLSQYFPIFSAFCMRWPKYWSFSFNISPSSKYSGLISFRMDWFDLLAVHQTLESPPTPQFKASILWH